MAQPGCKWKKISGNVVHRNPWFKVWRDRVRKPDGAEGLYHHIETRGPSVFIVALSGPREVVLVRQHRYPTDLISLEIPGGSSDSRTLLESAKRELLEEAGFAARKWRRAGWFQVANGICKERTHVFIARGLKASPGARQREEGISRVIRASFAEVLKGIASGAISDGQSIAALFKAGLKMKWF